MLCGLAIAILLFTIIKVKLEPFVALLLTGLGLALAAGLPVKDIVGTAIKSGDSLLETGFGSILGHIAVIIGLGTVLGAILERSGGADVLTSKLLGVFGERGAPIAMGLLGLIFGIPVFFDIGIFVLAPLVYVAAKRGGKSLVLYAMPMVAGLSMTHAFLPPHPGPVALGGLLEVSLGWLDSDGIRLRHTRFHRRRHRVGHLHRQARHGGGSARVRRRTGPWLLRAGGANHSRRFGNDGEGDARRRSTEPSRQGRRRSA